MAPACVPGPTNEESGAVVADVTMGVTEYALRGLAQRADVRANNVSNLNTPGFRAQRVDFESSLQDAIARGTPARAAAPVVSADPTLPNPNGGTVDLENEMVGMIKDNLMRDALVNAYNAKVTILRTAIGGR